MLSKKATREIGRIFQIFFLVGVSPFYWDTKNSNLKTTKSKWRLRFWKGTALIFIISGPYSLMSFVYRFTQETFSNTTDVILHLIWSSAITTMAVSTLSTLMYTSELQECVNQILCTDQLLSGLPGLQSNGRKAQKRDMMGILLSMTIPCLLWNLMSLTLMYLMDVDNPRFFTSILIPLGKYLIFVRLLSELFSFLHVYFVIIIFWMILFAVFSTVTNHWIEVIRKASIFHGTSQSTGLEKSLRTYRRLRVLIGLYNSCLSSLAWPSFILSDLSCHGLCIYITVKLIGNVDPVIAILHSFWAVFWFVVDFTVFPHMGRMKELSLDYLHHLNMARVSKHDKQIIASLQPLSVKVGNFFVMSKVTVLTIVVIVCNLTINALLLI